MKQNKIKRLQLHTGGTSGHRILKREGTESLEDVCRSPHLGQMNLSEVFLSSVHTRLYMFIYNVGTCELVNCRYGGMGGGCVK